MTGSLKRIGALFYARNLEFVRDRAALVWNLAFPLLLVLGFTLIFSGPPSRWCRWAWWGAARSLCPAARRAAAQAHPL